MNIDGCGVCGGVCVGVWGGVWGDVWGGEGSVTYGAITGDQNGHQLATSWLTDG